MDPFLEQLKAFATPLVERMASLDLLGEVQEIDHGCYRVATVDRYEFMKSLLSTKCRLLSEASVNGRPIATFKLPRPVEIARGFAIEVVEIPSPKASSPYVEGFEHIEAVTKMRLEDFVDRHPSLDFDRHNFHASINRDISILFDLGCVKFHEQSLAAIIEIENRGK